MYLAKEAWLHTFQIDIPRPTEIHLAKLPICSYKNYSNICSSMNSMRHFIQHLHDSMEHDLKETIQAIKILVPHTKLFESSRNGRAIFPFIGSMAKGLFGLATMSDVQLLANHINALNAKSKSITEALQQHSDHLSSFVKVIDKRTSNLMQGIKDNSLEIQTVAHSFQLAIVSSEQSMLQNAFQHVQSLVEGRISPFLIPKHDFSRTLHQIQSTLNKKYPGFFLTHSHPSYYYTTSNFIFTRNFSSLFITVQFPVSSHAQPLQLYKIISLPVPTPTNKTTMHATKLLDLPQYLALTYQHDYYLPLSTDDLTNCVHGPIVFCTFNKALIPITVPDCFLALFQNNVKQVSRLCNFRFLENHLSHDIIELTPTSVLVYDSEELDLVCPHCQRKIPGCTFCVINIPCKCSLSTRKLYFSPRLVDCYESNSNFSILHPVNLALVHEFFDEKRFTSILADSLFTTPVQLAIPDFSFYNHTLNNISGKLEDRLSQKKIELADKEHQLRQLEMPIEEPPPQGNLNYRCTNCHIRGHKADNNKGNNVCKNDRCSTFLICGQKEKHKEFREERKSLQTKIRNIRLEVESLIAEENQFSEYKERNDASFIKVMKGRLRKIDPLKYSKPSVLMRHLMCLKSIYNGKIPPVTQNDRIELLKMVERADEKKRELNSDSENESFVPTSKKIRSSVQRNQNVSQTYSNMHYQNQQFQQTVLQHHPRTPYNMIPQYPLVNYANVPQQPQPQHLFDQYTVSMQPSYNPIYPNISMSRNPSFSFNQMPLQVIPPQSPYFSYSTPADDVYNSSTDEDTQEDKSKPPKIWSPVGLWHFKLYTHYGVIFINLPVNIVFWKHEVLLKKRDKNTDRSNTIHSNVSVNQSQLEETHENGVVEDGILQCSVQSNTDTSLIHAQETSFIHTQENTVYFIKPE
ncbi:unnamed protein product [Mytilus coruscus]|uniref:Uncharacterized protein n=1 Tax=Mytilus coruscus TaxID=42192 RepID=A0A6J8B8R5_MYTCO|nr:unnamed protein product [Mytilus coruscus]